MHRTAKCRLEATLNPPCGEASSALDTSDIKVGRHNSSAQEVAVCLLYLHPTRTSFSLMAKGWSPPPIPNQLPKEVPRWVI